MRKRGTGECSPIKRFVGELYKVMAISSELMARVRNESWSVVVYEKGIAKEIAI